MYDMDDALLIGIWATVGAVTAAGILATGSLWWIILLAIPLALTLADR